MVFDKITARSNVMAQHLASKSSEEKENLKQFLWLKSTQKLDRIFQDFLIDANDFLYHKGQEKFLLPKQNNFFESARLIKVNQSPLKEKFHDTLNSGLNAVFKHDNSSTKDIKATLDSIIADLAHLENSDQGASLALIQQDEIEIDVVITSICSKIHQSMKHLYHPFFKRLENLIDTPLTEQENPFEPRFILNTVKYLLLDLKIQYRHICELLRFFYNANHLKLQNFYDENNAFLEKNHLNCEKTSNETLAEPKTNKTTHPPSSTQKPTLLPPADAKQSFNQAEIRLDFNTVLPTTMLSAIEQAREALPPSDTEQTDLSYRITQDQMSFLVKEARKTASFYAEVNTQNLSPADIAQLSKQQKHFEWQPKTSGLPELKAEDFSQAIQPLQIQALQTNISVDLRDSILTLLKQRQEEGQQERLSTSTEECIDLVAVFFEKLMDNKDLPIPFKLLLMRLQIPFLKLALRENDLFNQTEHPAIRLIDLIAEASIGWQGEDKKHKDKFYISTYKAVMNIVKGFKGKKDISTFDKSLKYLERFYQKIRAKSEKTHQLTRLQVLGLEKQSLAQQEVKQALSQWLPDRKLPIAVAKFAYNEWKNVLTYLIVKTGSNTPEWKGALSCGQKLIQLAGQKYQLNKIEQRQCLKTMETELTHLVKFIDLDNKLTDHAVNNCLMALEHHLDNKLNENDYIMITSHQFAAHKIFQQSFEAIYEHPTMPSRSLVQGQKIKSHRSAIAKQQSQNIENLDATLIRLKNFTENQWFKYSHPNQVDQKRIKLSLLTPEGKYLLVNRFGIKVLLIKAEEMAYMIKKGFLTPLQNKHFFRRNMAKVVHQIQKNIRLYQDLAAKPSVDSEHEQKDSEQNSAKQVKPTISTSSDNSKANALEYT
jgi:hypothetical protein